MLVDASSLSDGDLLQTDLCIVGAGPAGLALAREFAGSDMRVCLVESGGVQSSVRTHRLTAGRNVGASYHRLMLSRDRAFGGTSVRFTVDSKNPGHAGWRARPLDPIDFEHRACVPHSGWPFGYDELAQYYGRAQQISGLGPYTYDPGDWQSDHAGHPLPLDPSEVETTMFQLGLTTFSRWRNDFERYRNIQTILRATVMEIVPYSDTNSVSHLVVARPDNMRFKIRARWFVIAAGGIDNARLLLASNSVRPRGLGNDNDLVGRFFMERLATRSGYIQPTSAKVVDDAEFYANKLAEGRKDLRIEGVLRLPDDVIRQHELQNTLFYVLRRSRAFMAEGVRSAGVIAKSWRRQPLPDQLDRHALNVLTDWRELGRVAGDKLRRGPLEGDRVLLLRVQAEQSPNPESRVTLDHKRDPLGMPKARLAWLPTTRDVESIRRSQQLVGAAFEQAGLGTLAQGYGDEDPPAPYEGDWHHMGTTRMAADPRMGVTDADGKVHGIDNLYLTGSSLFPTSGASNPTLTIVALALRLASHLQGLQRRPSGTV